MKRRIRTLAAMTAVLCAAAALFAGCGERESAEETERAAEEAVVLSGIYEEQRIAAPEGFQPLAAADPVRCGDGSLLWLANDGRSKWAVVRSDDPAAGEGQSCETWPVPLAEGEDLLKGAFSGERLVFLSREEDGALLLKTFDREESAGTCEILCSLDEILPETGQVYGPAADREGVIALARGNTAAAVSADGKLLGQVSFGGRLMALTAGESGFVVVQEEGGRITASLADFEKGALRHTAELPGETFHVAGGRGFDLYYAADDGVYGLMLGDGESGELLLHYMNSGMNGQNCSLLTAFDAASLFFMESSGGKWIPVLRGKGEDRTLEGVEVLTLACDTARLPMPAEITAVIADFNASHPDIYVKVEDYASYNTRENPYAGEEKLARDLVTGLAKPDILFGHARSTYMRQVYKHGLYQDLLPRLEADPDYRAEDLFDSVRRAFDDGKGGLWGIAPSFTLTIAYTAARETIAPYAEQGYWTLEQLTDFAESLPEGVPPMQTWCRGYYGPLVNGGFMEFIDRKEGTCSFDSPSFVRYLKYAASLPTMEEYNRRYPFASMGEGELAVCLREGQLAGAVTFGFGSVADFIGMTGLFGTEDWAMIGMPAPEERYGAGNRVDADFVFVITSRCREPDPAWELIRASFAGSGATETGGFPAFRSKLRERAAGQNVIGMSVWGSMTGQYAWTPFCPYDADFIWYYDGTAEVRMKDPDEPLTEDALKKPGFVTDFTAEDFDKLERLLDTAGMPFTVMDLDEDWMIAREEMSAMFAGTGTPEDCAAKIQSRVSIWLAENR